uniref:Uncharacterized protein n=1 Tax=Amphora coffeiformis TaxID=265554 RepID=A0A7S3LGI2_9STRA|mmetsp:Transcript_16480/g.31326  ORF Transcript_16480/g.31326 Transcript_16480/m.31326 type:complete len:258 (-) Transcript_16480:202-975(-)
MLRTPVENQVSSVTMDNDIHRINTGEGGQSKEGPSSDEGECLTSNGLPNPQRPQEQEKSVGDNFILRHKVVEALKEKLLRSCASDERIKASAPRLAESLASIVLTHSNSIDEHTSPQHMNERLRSLVEALKQRRNKKVGSCSNREGFLRKILGPEKHVRVRRLAEQIKLARLQKVGEGCAQCRMLENGTMVCPRPEGPSKSFPRPVQRLFFKVDLMHALEFRSIQTWQETNWDGLIAEAEEILREYQDWRDLKQVSS